MQCKVQGQAHETQAGTVVELVLVLLLALPLLLLLMLPRSPDSDIRRHSVSWYCRCGCRC